MIQLLRNTPDLANDKVGLLGVFWDLGNAMCEKGIEGIVHQVG